MIRRRRGTWPPEAEATDWGTLRQDLWFRAGGRCELCRGTLGASGVVHHRQLRSQGGSDDPGNLVVLHDTCHKRIHANVLWARRHGWIIPSWDTPADRPPVPCDDTTCDGEYERTAK